VLIRLRSVVLEYDGGLPTATAALGGVDLDVHAGECLAVIGPTGSGKTSLLEVVAGLTRPTAGEAAADGAAGPDGLKALAGLVYQFPESQFFEDTVADDVAFGPRRQGLPEHDVDERVWTALDRAGLPPDRFALRSPLSLSAGEKRRAAIACILALARPFLLLDEPTAGLDPLTRERIAELIMSEAALGRGVVVVTHDLELADRVAGRTVAMYGGRIVADRPTGEVFSDGRLLRELCLEPPARYALVEAVRSRIPAEAAKIERLLLPRLADAPGR
jgi:energy-coupling factor transporter ATP-binding protein EcfA2